jgi:hypothetical protein
LSYLAFLSTSCLAGLALLSVAIYQFLDDAPFLVSDNDLRTALTLFDILLLFAAALWLLSFAVGALYRRIVLRRKGL